MKQPEPQDAFLKLKEGVKTLVLSTLTEEAKPNVSYAPFVEDSHGNFYLFLSQIAAHTQDLLSHPTTSVMLIEDEQDSCQIFARQRISYQCQVDVVFPDDPDYETMLNLLQLRFGNIIELLTSLPDFILFKLHPYHGEYVMGFGKAYHLEGDDLTELVHIDLDY